MVSLEMQHRFRPSQGNSVKSFGQKETSIAQKQNWFFTVIQLYPRIFRSWMHFFTEELFLRGQASNQYICPTAEHWYDVQVSGMHIQKYVGVVTFMSIYRYPSVANYWGRCLFEHILQTSKQLQICRKYLHFIDTKQKRWEAEYDQLYKIRSV